ncbi:MAG TPA: GerMN domain-containing protein [Candidatus Coprovivens excrementavium]|nr:GerMN domain-containing protein [Candidatus Coprovivens excrementavium]
MLKRFTFKKLGITTLLLLLALILYNYPEVINEEYIPEQCENINIYLIDKNDFVAMTEIETNNKNINDQIKEILNALIIGNNEEKLPEGFKAVIPRGTKILSYQLNDGLLKINFSREFLSSDEKDEEKMIEAIVFSLTSINDVKKIMIFVENERLTELPKSKKKLDLYLDRKIGINKVVDITSLNNTEMITVYYLSNLDNKYYIPISYITNDEGDKIEIIINNLKTNRLYSSNLSSHLDYQVELMNYEATTDEVILDFNDILLASVYKGKLKEEIKYAISYSIYDTLGIENITFQVNNQKIDEFRLES